MPNPHPAFFILMPATKSGQTGQKAGQIVAAPMLI
jgi:hypothetical protein